MQLTRTLLGTTAILAILSGCSKPIQVLALSTTIQTVSTDTAAIVAADKSVCLQNVAVQGEFITVLKSEHGGRLPGGKGNELYQAIDQGVSADDAASSAGSGPCDKLSSALSDVIAANSAVASYASALSALSRDSFVSTSTDAATAGSILGLLKVSAPVQAAVHSVFNTIENISLSHYRKSELTNALTGDNAAAFKRLVSIYPGLASQYQTQLDATDSNIILVAADLSNKRRTGKEPIASAELQIRFHMLSVDVLAKQAALKAYENAIAKVGPAFDDAAASITHPKAADDFASLKSFIVLAQDAHQKLQAAFAH